MIRTRSAGGIVLGDGGTVAMVRGNNSQSWLFPKGHIEEGETDEEAARREIAEETGLADLEYLDDLGEYSRLRVSFNEKSFNEEEEKTIRMFLFAAPSGTALAPAHEIQHAEWVPYREVPGRLGTPHEAFFAKDRAWFAEVFDRVQEAVQRD